MSQDSKKYKSKLATFLYSELPKTSTISEETLTFVCEAVDDDAAALQQMLNNCPREVKSASMRYVPFRFN